MLGGYSNLRKNHVFALIKGKPDSKIIMSVTHPLGNNAILERENISHLQGAFSEQVEQIFGQTP